MVMPWKVATKVANHRAVTLERIYICMLVSVGHAISGQHVGQYLSSSIPQMNCTATFLHVKLIIIYKSSSIH
jgi:hypothetical protein